MYLVTFLVLFSLWPYFTFSAVKPLKQRLRTLADCDLPASAYDPDPAGRVRYSTRVWTAGRRSFINGTFFIARKTLPVKYSVRGFKMDKGRRKPDFSITSLSCNNPVISLLLKRFKVKYDPDDCTGSPGNYTSDVLSLDEVSKTYKYMMLGLGTYIFELEFRTINGVIVCFAATIEVEK